MSEPKVKYKKVDSLVHGEVKEIRLIGYDERFGQVVFESSKQCYLKVIAN